MEKVVRDQVVANSMRHLLIKNLIHYCHNKKVFKTQNSIFLTAFKLCPSIYRIWGSANRNFFPIIGPRGTPLDIKYLSKINSPNHL